MDVVLSGVITHVLQGLSGVSQSGREWQKQAYVLEHEHGQYPKSVTFSVMGAKIAEFNMQQGEVVTVHLNIDCHEYQGRWYNEIQCWKVERNSSRQGNTQQPEQSAPAPQPAPQAQAPQQETKPDELPF